MRHGVMIARLLLPLALLSCGGGEKKKVPNKPIPKNGSNGTTQAPKENEADRDKKRHAAAVALIPDGTTCLPTSLKDASAPRLDLAAVTINDKSEAVVCANDTDKSRLLGPIACWTVDLASGGLTYMAGRPLPGHGIDAKVDEGCARGYCVPGGTKASIAHMAWNLDGSKVAVLVGDDVHLFDAGDKSRYSGFSIRGDKGATGDTTALHWVDDTIFVEGPEAVWVFKAVDGTAQGPIEALGGKDPKPLSPHGGAFATLDKARVAVAEQGFSTVTTYEVDSGKRTKIVRKVAPPPCKKPEIDAYWAESGEVSPKCKDFMAKNFGYFIGADALAGKTSLLVLLRGSRLGELGVLDAKNLTEKKSIKLQWCEGGGAAGGGSAGDDVASDAADDKAPAKKGTTRGPTKKAAPKKPGATKEEDPDAGGQ